MMEVLRCLGIEFVVMGNHEFDHSAVYLQQLLLGSSSFTSFGSNIRSAADGSIMDGLVDTAIVPLQDGLVLGMFGVCTTVTGEDPFAGPEVCFEDEIAHAKRCVASLIAAGADVIVALTHLKMKDDKRLARQVPEIALILGGHDHEPTTEFVGNTMIHKSGQDAWWLGKIELTISKIRNPNHDDGGLPSRMATIDREWEMLFNRGNAPHAETRAVIDRYLQLVDADDRANGKLTPIARSLTALDGTRATSRRGECNVGYLVADALRVVLDADVAIVHAGLIKGDLLNPPGLEITQRWLERTLPQPRPTVVVELSASVLQLALEHMLRRYPAMSSSMPQVSGLHVVYDLSPTNTPGHITSLLLATEPEHDLVASNRLLRVALPVVPSLDGWHAFFAAPCERASSGQRKIVRDVVALYLSRHAHGTLAYARQEHRIKIIGAAPPIK
jgi:2',3'-cyclic-nucleotide 2'-phosphodiesterase (5'-nucleotidase family)